MGAQRLTAASRGPWCARASQAKLGSSRTAPPALTLWQVSTYAVIWPARLLPGHCTVAAVAARSGARAAAFARSHKIGRSFGSYDEVPS